jgi:hypothetical protein
MASFSYHFHLPNYHCYYWLHFHWYLYYYYFNYYYYPLYITFYYNYLKKGHFQLLNDYNFSEFLSLKPTNYLMKSIKIILYVLNLYFNSLKPYYNLYDSFTSYLIGPLILHPGILIIHRLDLHSNNLDFN